jgi:hypothetical protein
MEEPLELNGKPGEPVPQVDAQDLRTAFEIFRAAAKNHPGQHVGVSVEVLQRDCKPGANIRAVSYRFMMLNGFVSTAPEQLASWMKDGQLDDIVFREAAQIPMEFIGVGVERQGWPFDVDELLRRIGGTTG